MHTGERIKEERERLGFNQADFAELAGATRKTLFNWESGAASPNAEALAAWASEGLDVLYVITGKRSMPIASASTNVDEVLLAQVIVGVDQMLSKARKTMPPAKKAQHIAALYKSFSTGQRIDEAAFGETLTRAA